MTEDKDQLGSSFGSRRRRLGNSPSPILLRILSAAENSNDREPFRLRMLLYFYRGSVGNPGCKAGAHGRQNQIILTTKSRTSPDLKVERPSVSESSSVLPVRTWNKAWWINSTSRKQARQTQQHERAHKSQRRVRLFPNVVTLYKQCISQDQLKDTSVATLDVGQGSTRGGKKSMIKPWVQVLPHLENLEATRA